MLKTRLRILLVTAFGTLLVFGSIAASAAGRIAVRGNHGIVASSSAIASAVGVQVLKDGGNAIDATIATAFAMAVTWPG